MELFASVALGVALYPQRVIAGPQNGTSSLSEQKWSVLTIKTETGEEPRVPHLHILRVAMSLWVVSTVQV
jgi:hypothetical protein